MLREKEFWYYQNENVTDPWALCVYARVDSENRQVPYSLNIRFIVILHFTYNGIACRRIAIDGRSYETGDDFLTDLTVAMSQYGQRIGYDDMQSLIRFWMDCIIAM